MKKKWTVIVENDALQGSHHTTTWLSLSSPFFFRVHDDNIPHSRHDILCAPFLHVHINNVCFEILLFNLICHCIINKINSSVFWRPGFIKIFSKFHCHYCGFLSVGYFKSSYIRITLHALQLVIIFNIVHIHMVRNKQWFTFSHFGKKLCGIMKCSAANPHKE